MLIAIGIFSMSLFVVIQYGTSILDIILPINGSRPRHIQIMTEYFIDQEKYFFFILFHMTAAYCIGAAVMIGIGTMLITYLLHTCGMFRIARYEIDVQMCRWLCKWPNCKLNIWRFNDVILRLYYDFIKIGVKYNK